MLSGYRQTPRTELSSQASAPARAKQRMQDQTFSGLDSAQNRQTEPLPNLRWRVGWLKYVINSPQVHIWHHNHPDCGPVNRNFALTLSVWDWRPRNIRILGVLT